MKKKQATKTPRLTKYTIALFLFNITASLAIVLLKDKLPPVVPLLYGKPQGEEQLAPAIALSVPNAIAAAVAIANLGISKLIENKFLKQVLLGTAITATILSTVTVLKIFFLVGSPQ